MIDVALYLRVTDGRVVTTVRNAEFQLVTIDCPSAAGFVKLGAADPQVRPSEEQRMGTEAKPPAQWADETRSEFKKLVCEGGEVATLGLAERIEKAVTLVCHHAGNNLIGVAALKRPEDTYRTKVSERSGLKLSNDAFPFELGWVYVQPEGRGRGLSKQLVATCLVAADSAGVFATTREDNDPMRCCLAKSGFKRLGRPYKSGDGDYYLVVYVREAPKAEPGAAPDSGGM